MDSFREKLETAFALVRNRLLVGEDEVVHGLCSLDIRIDRPCDGHKPGQGSYRVPGGHNLGEGASDKDLALFDNIFLSEQLCSLCILLTRVLKDFFIKDGVA